MTPAQLAIMADARHLLLVLAPLCAHLPGEKHASHLEERCLKLARRIEQQTPAEEGPC